MLDGDQIPNVLGLIRQQEREKFADEVRMIGLERTKEPYAYDTSWYTWLNDVIERAL